MALHFLPKVLQVLDLNFSPVENFVCAFGHGYASAVGGSGFVPADCYWYLELVSTGFAAFAATGYSVCCADKHSRSCQSKHYFADWALPDFPVAHNC